jgi:MATE family multidrug resistance protein
MATRDDTFAELRPLLRLAWPVITAELGWMAMGLVDTIIVGRLGAEAIGAVSIGSGVFFAFAIFGIGMLLGLDYLVANAFGRGVLADAHHALVDGLYLAAALAVGLTAGIHLVAPLLSAIGVQPTVAAGGVPYLLAVSWSLPPLLLFTALRRYLQALGLVQPIMVAVVSANVVNAVACTVLVFGLLGAPALGPTGAGWATTISRGYMLAFLVAYLVWREGRHPSGLWHVDVRPSPTRLAALVRLGWPAATHITAEVGVFSVVTALAARFEPAALAGHQIALNSAATTFMVPLGISSAAAVRVGQALGRRDLIAARRAGWTALALGLAFMATAALAFVTVPNAILRLFTTDPRVLTSGVVLLLIAGAFQLFDGTQVVLTGALRGTGDTRTPMIANLIGYWVLGLPVGCLLCFRGGAGVAGLWLGLCLGLITVAITLLVVWSRRSAALTAAGG